MTLTETFGPIYLCQITSTESGPVSVSHADDEGEDYGIRSEVPSRMPKAPAPRDADDPDCGRPDILRVADALCRALQGFTVARPSEERSLARPS
jgi:hypothetical protein